MPFKYPILTPMKIISALQKIGFRFVSQKGSHMKYTDGIRVVIIPNHDTIARGTLKSILGQVGVGIDDFIKLL